MTVLSLFAGIGGLDRGLERAGMRVIGQVEIDPFCRQVLARHWPEVPCHDDVRTAGEWWRSEPRTVVDVVAGGFPCQPFSRAGRHGGSSDPRWGWPWMRDVLSGLRPRYVIVENSAALLGHRDVFGQLLGDLAELGFDAEWSVLTACALGAPHVRRRLFIVAYPHSGDGPERLGTGRGWPVQALDGGTGPWLHPVDGLLAAERRSRRMADGVPDRMEPARVRALGNAVVPQVAEFLGRIILQEETLSRTGPVPI